MATSTKQIQHFYPKQVHIFDSPYLHSLGTKMSQASYVQPHFNVLIKDFFRDLFIKIMDQEWPTEEQSVKTRMTEQHPEQKLLARVFKQSQKAVCVDIARAGMLPSQVFFDTLNWLVSPHGLRLDHIFASRMTNEQGQVTHTELSSSKIGGDIDDAIVFLPDPMGATGKSLCQVLDHYKTKVPGQAKAYISAHMIITPEFIRTVTKDHPDVIIFAGRLDRGLSSNEALKEPPGKLWDQERGLNDSQYIVPGAGGVGELINNSFV